MILKTGMSPIQSGFNINRTNISNVSNMSSHNVCDVVSFKSQTKQCEEHIKLHFFDEYNARFKGTINNLNCDVKFHAEPDYSKRKNIKITGTYAGKNVNIDAYYKDKKHHYYKGTFGDKEIDIKYRLGGLFIDDYMKGQINGENFYAKFPSASSKDDNRDLMVLLLHMSGCTPLFDGCNFSVIDDSYTRYSYFNGKDVYDNNVTVLYSLFDDIWTDPSPNPSI